MTTQISKKLIVNTIADETDEQALARTLLDPTTAAAILAVRFPPNGCDLEIDEVSTAIKTVVKQVQSGELSDIESMLVSQAKALQAMFVSLTAKAMEQSRLTAYQMMMNMALKAQNQCRSTLQALLELKFPRTTAFVKQQNIANGPQQVNNAMTPEGVDSCAKKNKIKQNKLSRIEDTRHERERLDIKGTTTSSRTNQDMEAVGKINRPKNGKRKKKSLAKRL